MKHGKRPTLKQKKMLKQLHLVPENWLVIRDTPETFGILNRASGRTRSFEKHKGYIEELYFERRDKRWTLKI